MASLFSIPSITKLINTSSISMFLRFTMCLGVAKRADQFNKHDRFRDLCTAQPYFLILAHGHVEQELVLYQYRSTESSR